MAVTENKIRHENATSVNSEENDNIDNPLLEEQDSSVYTLESLREELTLYKQQLKNNIVQKYLDYVQQRKKISLEQINLSMGFLLELISIHESFTKELNIYLMDANKKLLSAGDYFDAYNIFNEELQCFLNRELSPRLKKLKEFLNKGAHINYYHQPEYANLEELEKLIITANESHNPPNFDLLDIVDNSDLFSHFSPNYHHELQLIQPRIMSVYVKIGFTPLLLAANLNSFYLVKFLLDHGADVNQTNILGHSALTVACAFKFESIANLLLERKASATEVFLPSNLLPYRWNSQRNLQYNPRSTLQFACKHFTTSFVKKMVKNNKAMHLKNFLMTSPYCFIDNLFKNMEADNPRKPDIRKIRAYLKSLSVLNNSNSLAKEYVLYQIQNDGLIDFDDFIAYFPHFKKELLLLTLAKLYLEFYKRGKTEKQFECPIKKTTKLNLDERLHNLSLELFPLLGQKTSKFYQRIGKLDQSINRTIELIQMNIQSGYLFHITGLIHLFGMLDRYFNYRNYMNSSFARKASNIGITSCFIQYSLIFGPYFFANIQKHIFLKQNAPDCVKDLKKLAKKLPYLEIAEAIPSFHEELLTTVMEYCFNISHRNQEIMYQFHYHQFKDVCKFSNERNGKNKNNKEENGKDQNDSDIDLSRKQYQKSKTKYLRL